MNDSKIKEVDSKIWKIKVAAEISLIATVTFVISKLFSAQFFETLFWLLAIYILWTLFKAAFYSVFFYLFLRQQLIEKYVAIFEKFDFPAPEKFDIKNPELYMEEVAKNVKWNEAVAVAIITEMQLLRGTYFDPVGLLRTQDALSKALATYKTKDKKV